MKAYLTTGDLARVTGRSRRTIRNHIKTGKIQVSPRYDLHDHYRIRVEEARRYIESNLIIDR